MSSAFSFSKLSSTALKSISGLEGAICSRVANTTCLALRTYCRFVLSPEVSQGITIVERIGLISLEARNEFSLSFVESAWSSAAGSVIVKETSDACENPEGLYSDNMLNGVLGTVSCSCCGVLMVTSSSS